MNMVLSIFLLTFSLEYVLDFIILGKSKVGILFKTCGK